MSAFACACARNTNGAATADVGRAAARQVLYRL
jgi:hypothetical protein